PNNPNNRNRNPREFDPFDFFNFFGGPDLPDRSERVRNLGTGFIVDKAGFIVTNHHVVDKATKIMVRLEDKTEFQAKLIGSDTDTDLAIVKIEAGRDLPVVKMGNSDSVKVGDWVLAIGSPFSLDHTVTHGIISAKGRTEIGGARNDFQSFFQWPAAIAGVNRCIGLQKALEIIPCSADLGSALRADDTVGDGVIEAEGASNRQHPIAD